MSNDTNPARHYDNRTIWFHWMTALLVVLLYVSSQFIDYFPKGPARWDMLGFHMSMGFALCIIVAYRMRWRSLSRQRKGLPQSTRAASIGHSILYVTLIVALVLGIANMWVRGEHIFNFYQLEALDPGNKPLRKLAGDAHEISAYIILALAGLHGVIAFIHQYALRDGLMERMIPWTRKR